MRTRPFRRPGLSLAVLLAFAGVALAVNFFHTETGPAGREECPACHFLTSSLSTSPGPVVVVPALLCRGTLPAAEPLCSNDVVVFALGSRSPPQA